MSLRLITTTLLIRQTGSVISNSSGGANPCNANPARVWKNPTDGVKDFCTSLLGVVVGETEWTSVTTTNHTYQSVVRGERKKTLDFFFNSCMRLVFDLNTRGVTYRVVL